MVIEKIRENKEAYLGNDINICWILMRLNQQQRKLVRYHILTQNLKTVRIWILLLICCSVFNFHLMWDI